jgi:predicted nicotinamide N-methyase
VTGTVLERIAVGGVELELERPADAESLIDERAFEVDEFLPYWAERWPGGVALAEHVAALDLVETRVLELGCGLGLPSLVAARRGADVVATDWSEDAMALLERNASRNGAKLTAVTADWRDPDALVALGPFDLVLAADVLYEKRNAAPILALLGRLGSPALVADPGRRHAEGFFAAARTSGWLVEPHGHEALSGGGIYHLSVQPTRRAIPGYSRTRPHSS